MEKFQYELRPYFFAAIATYALNQAGTNKLMAISAIGLMTIASIIVFLRLKYRGLCALRYREFVKAGAAKRS